MKEVNIFFFIIFFFFSILTTGCTNERDKDYTKKDELIEQLKEEDRHRQASAYLALEKIEDPEILPFLVNILNSPDQNDNARSYAASLIAKMVINSNKSALLKLQQALRSEYLRAGPRESVVLELVRLRDLAVPGLVDLIVLGKGEDAGSMSAMKALSQIRSDFTISSLIEALKKNDDEDIRSAISLTLTMIGQKSVPSLVSLLKNDDESLKECVWFTLKMITGEDFDMNYSSWKQNAK